MDNQPRHLPDPQPRHLPDQKPTDVDAIDLLTEDHRLVRQYFEHIETVSKASLAADRHRKPDLVRQVCQELEIHARIEEEIFYPAVKAAFKDSDDPLVDHAVEEHAEAKRLIAELRAMSDDDPRMDDTLAALRKAVEHHVHDEEEQMFTKARGQIDGRALGRQLAQQKHAILAEIGQIC